MNWTKNSSSSQPNSNRLFRWALAALIILMLGQEIAAGAESGYREATLNGVTIFGLDPADRSGSTFEAAFDGNRWTFYDYRMGGKMPAYVGFASEEAVIPRAIRFTPRYAYGKRMIGGRFEGSNVSSTEGYEPLYVITQRPNDSEQVVELQTTKAYRYFRYYGPAGTYCNIAEFGIEADAAGPVFVDHAQVFVGTDAGKSVVPLAFEFSRPPVFLGGLAGGQLQGSNTSLTSGYQTLHEFTSEPDVDVSVIELSVPEAYRYYRFVSPAGTSSSIAGFNVRWKSESGGPSLSDGYREALLRDFGITVFGRDPVWKPGCEFEAVFDFDPTTYYEFARSDTEDAYVGADIGRAGRPLSIIFTPRQGHPEGLVNCRFEASNEGPLTGFETLYTITSVPHDGWQKVEIDVAKTYRYFRFVAPAGTSGHIAEFNMEIEIPR